MNTEKIEFQARTGVPAAGEMALPEGTGKAPGVVVIQEWWGLNDHVRSIMKRLAAEGFVVVAPDLYHGKTVPLSKSDEAAKMMNALDWPLALAEIAGAVEKLRTHPRCSGKVSVMGFCMGGALTLATACSVPNLTAAVPFYGVPQDADWNNLKAPVLAHFALQDQWAKPEIAKGIQEKIKAAGGSMELCLYEADHAFFNDTRAEVHSPENANLAWERTIAFLKKQSQS